jgi:hypothetical protein
MLPQEPCVETGQTNQLIEDIPAFQEHIFIRQARTFIKGGSDPIVYYDAVRKSLPLVIGVEHKTAMELLTSIELALINTVATHLETANRDRKYGDTKATKPRELFVKYSAALEAIMKRGTTDPMALYREAYASAPKDKRDDIRPPVTKEPILSSVALQAKAVFQDLYQSTSLSEGDLTNPDWIDPYTQQIEIQATDPSEYFDKLVQHNRGIHPIQALLEMLKWDTDHNNTQTPVISLMSSWEKEVRRAADRCRIELKWTIEQANAWIQTQLGNYDAESDDILLPDDDSRNYTPPTLEEKELVLNRELWWSARDATSNFYRARSEVFAKMRAQFVKGRNWHSVYRKRILKTKEFAELLNALESVAQQDVVTAAAIYLNLAGNYGLMEEDVQGIRGLQTNSAESVKVGILEFAQAWEDDLLNLTQDALSPTSETSPHDFVDVLENTAELRKTMPHYHPNPIKTAAWNIGFGRAARSGCTWKQAEDAGWALWREEMDAKAAKLYDTVFKQTKNRIAAMAAFWSTCDKRVPRPQEKVVCIAPNKMGLIVGLGKKQRTINWNIVEIKLRNTELDLTDADGNDRSARLLAKLQELGVGKRVWNLLQSQYVPS